MAGSRVRLVAVVGEVERGHSWNEVPSEMRKTFSEGRVVFSKE